METMARNEQVEQLVDYIMKHCLWQFHSRTWDRERQNKEILRWAKQMLIEGKADQPADRLERCHWVDGVALAQAYQTRHPWISDLSAGKKSELLDAVHARLDYLTITGSLNLELTDHQY